jgi:phosphopantothenoylcysteine decarboxylase/phosphopantothenate--cysteine ligase
MNTLADKRIALVVAGGIAAYKVPEIARRLRESGAEVRVIMTRAAQEFVGPLTFQAISGNPVHTDLLDPAAEAAMGHIELARWADLLLVAPATANFLAGICHGFAGDLATAVCLATAAPIVVAPAMNQQMWLSPATQENCAALGRRGVRFIGPNEGDQACGEVGPGRMSEPHEILDTLSSYFETGSLAGVRVLVTAGPTREAIDPVRFLSNRSSGKMGYAVARAAAEAGAAVTLISGPTALPQPGGIAVRRVTSADEMYTAVMDELENADIFISSAAVADYGSAAPEAHKIKKNDQGLTLTLAPTRDILGSVTERPNPPFTVGFAAETENLLENARAKLAKKSLRMIAANLVGRAGTGFDSDENELHVLWEGGEQHLDRAPKHQLARDLIAIIAQRYRVENTN